jgi:hypothetical protein
MSNRKMAGPFSIFHGDARKIHKKLPSIYARDLYISLFDFDIEENWKGPGEWVTGTFEATKIDIMRNAGIKRATFFRIAWPQLINSGLVSDNNDGTITITMLKKKKPEKLKEHAILSDIKQLITMYAKLNEQITSKINELYRTNLLNTSVESTTETLFDVTPLSEGQKSTTETKNDVELSKECTTETKVEKKECTTETMEGQKSTTYTDQSTTYTPITLYIEELDLKISLSLISLFYSTIGQKKISKEKRERALKSYEEMRKDGFTDDQIEFAVKWTLENVKDTYDFKIIKSTISQALAKKEEYEGKERIKGEKQAEKALHEEEERKSAEEAEYFRSLKEKMTPEERVVLRQNAFALAEKRKMMREFLKENTIEALENEILMESEVIDHGNRL